MEHNELIFYMEIMNIHMNNPLYFLGARWSSGRASDSRARVLGFEPNGCRVVSLSKTLLAPQSTGKYPGSGGSVPT